MLVAVLHALRRLLKGGEHASVRRRKDACRKNRCFRTCTSTFCSRLELIGHERIRSRQTPLPRRVSLHIRRACPWRKGRTDCASPRRSGDTSIRSSCCRRIVFRQNTPLDDLVHRRGGQAQPRVKTPLNLGKVVALDVRHRVDVLLTGDDDPHLARAARSPAPPPTSAS